MTRGPYDYVAQRSIACHYTRRGGVGEHRDAGKPRRAVQGESPAGLCHLHEAEHTFIHPRAAGSADDDNGPFLLRRKLDGASDLFPHDGSHGGCEEVKVHHRQPDRMAINLGRPCGHGVRQACLFLVALQALRVGGDSFKFQGIHRHHVGIGFTKGLGIDQAGDSLARTQGKVVVAFRADTKVLGEREVVNHLSAGGAFRPEPLWHLARLASNGLETGFSKDRHSKSKGRRSNIA